MAFTTNIFIFIFFPFSVLGYYLIKMLRGGVKLQNLFLIMLSLGFYGWACFDHIFYFCGLIFFIYLAALLLELLKAAENEGRSSVFALALFFLFGVLVFYKYRDFILSNINQVLEAGFEVKKTAVPLGISFIIFSSVSYLADVYRGDQEAGSVLDAALYLTFFPKVISGPIVRWKDFSGLLSNRRESVSLFVSGMERLMIGFFKKTVIADTLGAAVSSVLSDLPYGIDRVTAWGGVFLFMLQLYYDFSGYSDIAIGIGRIFGFPMAENFHFPYVAVSLTEFWRRWHISLGSWFREYLYIPLGGNRRGNVLVHLFLVFLATGVWHGAGWNYILWGIMNGILILVERLVWKKRWYQSIPRWFKWIFTLLFIYFSWVVFMTPTLSVLAQYVETMLFGAEQPINFSFQYYFDRKVLSISILGLAGVLLGFFEGQLDRVEKWTSSTRLGSIARYASCFLLFGAALLFMVNATYRPFLYFQF